MRRARGGRGPRRLNPYRSPRPICADSSRPRHRSLPLHVRPGTMPHGRGDPAGSIPAPGGPAHVRHHRRAPSSERPSRPGLRRDPGPARRPRPALRDADGPTRWPRSSPRSPSAWRRSTRCCAGPPGSRPCSATAPCGRGRRPGRRARGRGGRTRGRARRRTRRPGRARDGQRRRHPSEGRPLGRAARSPAHGGRGGRPRRLRSHPRRGRGHGLGAGRAVRARPARGPRPGLGRAHLAGARPPARSGGSRGGRPAGPTQRRRPVHRRCGAGDPRGPPQPRLQGGGRDRRAGRQHQRAALGHPRRRPAAPGPAGRFGRGHRAGPHPLGIDRDHLPAQRPPDELRRGRADRRART